VEVRPATTADFAAELAVLDAAEGELRQRHGFPWRAPPLDVFAETHAHLLATDPDRSFVAETNGRVIAFTAAWVRGETWFLSDLFVHPDYQADGLGTRLLDLAWGAGPERRMTVADAIQPVSNAMYARRGLVPATPILELGGTPSAAPVWELRAVDATPGGLRPLDALVYGFDRSRDHEHWFATGLRATAWERDGDRVAYSYASPAGRIGPVVGRDEASAAAAMRNELARLDGREAVAHVPGSSRALVEVALAAGLRISGPPGLLLLSAGLQAPRALAVSGYWLL
jgi:GNAT superfamily N-acetyltransferase